MYRYLCEKKIKQLNPCQTFPITEKHLKENDNELIYIDENPKPINFNNSHLGNNSCRSEKTKNCIPASISNINTNINLIPKTDEKYTNKETLISIEKFNELKEKYEKLKNEVQFLKENNNFNLNNLADKHNEYSEIEQEYYSIDSLNENEIKKKYKKIFLYFNKILTEKNNFKELFCKEKAFAEDLKKENLIIRETLEKEIIKFGINNKILSSDNLINLNKIKADVELTNKEAKHFKNLTEKYYQEIENLKSVNHMVLKNKEKIMFNFEEGLKDLDSMKEKIKFLENENLSLKHQMNNYPINKEQNILEKNSRKNSEDINNDKLLRRNTYSDSDFNNKNSKFNADINDECKDGKNRNNELDNISVNSNTSIISKNKKITITKHLRTQSNENNTNYIKSINENTINSNNENFKKNKNIDLNYNEQFEYDNNRSNAYGMNKNRTRSSLSHGKLYESNNSKNNFYGSNNNFYSSNSNEILVNRISEYKKNYEKLNLEFEELIKIKSSLEIQNSDISNQLNSCKEKAFNLEKILEEKENQLREYKIEKEKWNKDLSNMLNKLNEISYSGNNDNNHLILSLKEYRKLYEELNLEYEEMKNTSHKKVRNQQSKLKALNKELTEKDKILNKINNENFYLKKEIELCKTSYEKIDNEKQYLNDNEKIKEKELNLALDMSERLRNQIDSANKQNKNLQKQLEELNSQKAFDKQKYEYEINSKNKELDETKLLYENLKKENQKFKDEKKDTNRINFSNYISQENESLNNQLNEYIIKEKEYNLTVLKLEKLEKENEKLNHIGEEAKKNRISLENQITDLIMKKESLEKEIVYLKKNTEFTDEVYNEKNKEIERLKKIINDINYESEDLQNKINCVIRDKERIEENCFEMQNDFNRKNNSIDKLYSENLLLNDNIAIYKVNLNSLFAELKINVNKLNQKANEDLDSLFTKDFSQNILRLVSIFNNFINNNEEKDIFDLARDFINVFLCEFEILYEKLFEDNNYIQDCNQRHILLEDNFLKRRIKLLTVLFSSLTVFKVKIIFHFIFLF